MGVQLLLRDYPGALRRWKEKKKVQGGVTRVYGHQWRTSPKVDRMALGPTTGYWVDRPTIKGHAGAAPDGRLDTGENAAHRAQSGTAFTWWTAMTTPEKNAMIARVVAENEVRQEQGKAAAAVGTAKTPKKEPQPCIECGKKPQRTRQRCVSCYSRWQYQRKKKGPR